MQSFTSSHQHSSNAKNSTSLPDSNGNPFDAFATQSRSNHGTSAPESNNSSYVSVHRSRISDEPSSFHLSSSRSSEYDQPSSTFATATSITLRQPSGSNPSYSSHQSVHSTMNNSNHCPESLSMHTHIQVYEHDTTFTSSNPSSHHASIPTRIITSSNRFDYHDDTLLERIVNTQR